MPSGAIDLSGRVALVTGAARGIGAATAVALAEAGARVALVDRDAAGLDATADSVGRAGSDALGITADVTDAPAIERAVDTIVAEWGRLDVLVNNAGIVRDATLAKVTDEDWTATLEVNLRGAMIATRAAVRPMRAAGSGRILSATSVVARMGNYGQTAYAASKAGIIGMTRVWARELGPAGITANAVAPGLIDTEMARAVPEKVLGALIARTAARRLGRPEEVAAVYAFLASDLASFINGAVIGVDGGLLL
jgi:3-oxoacyl-[acyl-carrier protein] reductase